eukprot:gene43672-54255_t
MGFQTPFGDTPLIIACIRGHIDVVRYLIHGAGVNLDKQNYNGDSALIAACHHGHQNCAVELLRAGAEMSIKNKYGYTALCLAKAAGRCELVELLHAPVQMEMMQCAAHFERAQLLIMFRVAAVRRELRLSGVESGVIRFVQALRSYFLCASSQSGAVRDANACWKLIETQNSLSFYSLDPQKVVSKLLKCYHLRLPGAGADSFPSFTTAPVEPVWQWPLVLRRVMYLPSALFEAVMDYLPMPRLWDHTLDRMPLRCKFSPHQAMLDLSCVADEIMCDANIISGADQTQMLVKISQLSELQCLLVDSLDMPVELVERLCECAPIQQLLSRPRCAFAGWRREEANRLHSVVFDLHTWYKHAHSAVKCLELTPRPEHSHKQRVAPFVIPYETVKIMPAVVEDDEEEE